MSSTIRVSRSGSFQASNRITNYKRTLRRFSLTKALYNFLNINNTKCVCITSALLEIVRKKCKEILTHFFAAFQSNPEFAKRNTFDRSEVSRFIKANKHRVPLPFSELKKIECVSCVFRLSSRTSVFPPASAKFLKARRIRKKRQDFASVRHV